MKYNQKLINSVHAEQHAQVALAYPGATGSFQAPPVAPPSVTQPGTGAIPSQTPNTARLPTSAQDRRPNRRNWQDRPNRFQDRRSDRRSRGPDRYHPQDIRSNPPTMGSGEREKPSGDSEKHR